MCVYNAPMNLKLDSHDPGEMDLERPKVCINDSVRSLTSSNVYYMDLISTLLFEESMNVLCL